MSFFHGVASCFLSVFLFFFSLYASDLEEETWVISSPMCGRVESILVTPGTLVERGTPLFVSEAMKMSMTTRAERRGYVGAVHMVAGDMITPSQNLISFQESPLVQPPQRVNLSTPEIAIALSQENAEPPAREHVDEPPVEPPYSAPLPVAQTAPMFQETLDVNIPPVNEILFNQGPDNASDFVNDDLFLTLQDQDGGDPPSPPVVADVQNPSLSFEMPTPAMLGAPPFGAETSFHGLARAPLLENMPRPTDSIDLGPPRVVFSKNIGVVPFDMFLSQKEKILSLPTKKASSFLAGEVFLTSIKKTEALSLLRNLVPESLAFHSLTQFFSSQGRGATFMQEGLFEQARAILKTSWNSLWFLSSQPLGCACILLAILLSFLPSPRQVLNHLVHRKTAYARYLATPKKAPARVRIYA